MLSSSGRRPLDVSNELPEDNVGQMSLETPHRLFLRLALGAQLIGAILGHAPASTTETYAPVRWTEKVEAIETLSYSNSAPTLFM
jgi:hypothetical protein